MQISNFTLEDSEDLLQEVFIKAYKNINFFDENISSFSSWIYRITHNEAINKFKKKQSRPFFVSLFTKNEQEEEVMIDIPDDIDIEKDYKVSEKKHLVHKILKLLEEKYKTVLVLKFLEEKSYEEISDILKIPLGTVATLIILDRFNNLKFLTN